MPEIEKEKGKILILKLYHKLFSILIRHNQILSIQIDDAENRSGTENAEGRQKTPASIGNIYVGKVHNVSRNIGAAFIEIAPGELAFLPLSEAGKAILTNRKADGKVKTGDELLVQLVKEPVKTKQAEVSTVLSLAGSYAVLENRPGSVRVSAKLGKKYHHLYKNSEPLQEIAKRFAVIIRTNAAEAETVSDVLQEAETLAGELERILTVADKRTCFSCLYQSEPAYLAFIKNCYRSEYDEIVTDEREIYDALLSDERAKYTPIRYYSDSLLPLYKLYAIETRIKELTDKKVWLKSGAYLVIEQTEALIAIDVNTGKYEAGKNPEETYLKINLEAAEAIAIALRARNLFGMILVDFINMKPKEHMEKLTEHMKNLLKKDSVPAYVVDITGLGLMEITRKKKNKSFAEQMKSLQTHMRA